MANEIIKNKLDIMWSDCATFKNMDTKLLKKLKKSGAARLVWGLESASSHILKYIGKGTTSTQAIYILKKAMSLTFGIISY